MNVFQEALPKIKTNKEHFAGMREEWRQWKMPGSPHLPAYLPIPYQSSFLDAQFWVNKLQMWTLGMNGQPWLSPDASAQGLVAIGQVLQPDHPMWERGEHWLGLAYGAVLGTVTPSSPPQLVGTLHSFLQAYMEWEKTQPNGIGSIEYGNRYLLF